MINKKNTKEKIEELDIKSIYTPLSVAREEILRRWNDKKLRKRVEDFLGGDVPEVFKKRPMAFLGRNVASPNMEFYHFIKLSKKIKINPLCIEYFQDKFVADNEDKYHLGKMYFYGGSGRKNGNKITITKVLDFNEANGKEFSELKTVEGENFIKFHHGLVDKEFSGIERFDISTWLKNKKNLSKNFYKYYLALFVCYGALFENYFSLSKEKGLDFTINIVIPAIREIEKKLGVKPIIVPLVPIEDESDLYWYCYPEGIKKYLK